MAGLKSLALVLMVCVVHGSLTAQKEYYPCSRTTCTQNTHCRVQSMPCVTSPCKPSSCCVGFPPARNTCPQGDPVLHADQKSEIRCSSGSTICPDYTACINGYCCWTGQLSKNYYVRQANNNINKSGECPSISSLATICEHKCNADVNCAGDQKCCSNGCGNVCTDPVASRKAGTCPVATYTGSSCSSTCSQDRQCPGSQKCCYNGCGYSCSNTQESYVKPGTCPSYTDVVTCGNVCSVDSSCPGQQKCCNSACGRQCVETLENSAVRACSSSFSVYFCFFDKNCQSDNDCGYGESCCQSTGCGRICQKPSPRPVSSNNNYQRGSRYNNQYKQTADGSNYYYNKNAYPSNNQYYNPLGYSSYYNLNPFNQPGCTWWRYVCGLC